FLGADTLACVFDDACAGRDLPGGKYAIAVQLGAAHDVPGLGGVSSGHESGQVAGQRRLYRRTAGPAGAAAVYSEAAAVSGNCDSFRRRSTKHDLLWRMPGMR